YSWIGIVLGVKVLNMRAVHVIPFQHQLHHALVIINRGGAILAVELFGSDANGNFDGEKGATVLTDGLERQLQPGEVLKLAPGESVTLNPGDWHAFWGENGDVLIGEVSTVNDDVTDNVFREPIGRFADIEEDIAPTHLLVSDYDTWFA
ncbi:MAG: D-lyxose/D-mannose family sugar isomerase, partial [Boseongicola sp. SB0667_bin_21]|nr:D-lyxose/D-mannose family sugar isomerase [Boseongicola sp. SB0667_bin_21]